MTVQSNLSNKLFLMATQTTIKLSVRSTEFSEGGHISPKYTCEGQNINPPLEIHGFPEETQTLAIIVEDPDAPRGDIQSDHLGSMEPSSTRPNDNTPGCPRYDQTAPYKSLTRPVLPRVGQEVVGSVVHLARRQNWMGAAWPPDVGGLSSFLNQSDLVSRCSRALPLPRKSVFPLRGAQAWNCGDCEGEAPADVQ